MGLCLGAACTGCIREHLCFPCSSGALPRRCLHGVHHVTAQMQQTVQDFASALPARGASASQTGHGGICRFASALPARGASPARAGSFTTACFASALPARGASIPRVNTKTRPPLCLGAACTGCIITSPLQIGGLIALPRRCLHGVHLSTTEATDANGIFASALPARGASCTVRRQKYSRYTLPRRCLHGVHRVEAQIAERNGIFASALPARGASAKADKLRHTIL